MKKGTFDFSGYATKNDIKCSDGRTILKDAFKHQDGKTVPLVWQHMHDSPDNILGKAILEHRDDGVYCYGIFNNTERGKNAKEIVKHGDVESLSIYANQLKEQSKKVAHGEIREISLVLAGANPGAKIENISLAHSDGTMEELEDEALIYSGVGLSHEDEPEDKTDDKPDKKLEHADNKDSKKTVGEVFETFNPEQKEVVLALISHAVAEATGEEEDNKDNAAEHSDKKAEGDKKDNKVVEHSNTKKEGEKNMKRNAFDPSTQTQDKNVLTHSQLNEILADAKGYGSLKESFLAHVKEYGFDPIDVLFPDAKDVNGGLVTIKRDTTWVDIVLSETNHTPFSRIKTRVADLTADDARAKGYVTGNLKKEEIIPLLKRSTTPTTIYKKQKLDRDDVSDITDFDVVAWLRKEMRDMLNEELARSVLIGDGRDIASEDKVNEQNIRPIMLDNDSVYVHRVEVDAAMTTDEIIDEFIRSRKYYKGSGAPTLFASTDLVTDMLLVKDKQGRRIYNNLMELASVLRVSKIVEVELMNGATRKVGEDQTNSVLGIVVNLKDYTIGADKGGNVAMFDDFDIDYNQQKYLIETRCSGALTMPKSALIIEKRPAGVPAQ